MRQGKTYHKASINTNRHAQHTEQICDLINVIAQSTGPANADVLLKEWTEGVKDTPSKWKNEDVVVWEG